MSFAFSDYLRNLIRDRLFRTGATSIRPAAGQWFDVLKTLPTDKGGTGIAAFTMTSYVIKQIIPLDANFGAIADGHTSNTAVLDYGTLTGTLERAIGLAIYDVAARTNLEMFGPLATGWLSTSGHLTGDVFTAFSHGFVDTDRVFLRGENLPTGVNAQTEYFIVGATTDTFQVSLTSGGAAVTLTADGYGDIGASKAKDVASGDKLEFAANDIDILLDF